MLMYSNDKMKGRNEEMLHVVCYSGGIESALAAIEVIRRYGRENVILLNHDISPEAEDPDIKQYKLDIAAYLGLPVTSCNAVAESYQELDQLKGAVERGKFKGPNGEYCTYYLKSEPFNRAMDPLLECIKTRAFKVGNGTELCTNRLKTAPFEAWLDRRIPDDLTIHYGFTPEEFQRVERRRRILAARGVKTDFPLLWPERTIHNTAEIGIPKPEHYRIWKHGNCIGCLKAGWQHWYCVYVHRRDRWNLAKFAEESIGYAINRRGKIPCRLTERESEFETLHLAGLPATEWIPPGKFWSMARKLLKQSKET